MSETHDHSKLKWIKDELDTLILQARTALEEYMVGAAESGLMTSCADNLHQVYGTLQIVELYGATMLAEEMELVARSIADDQLPQGREQDAAEALMQGLARLPDYLEKLQGGALDHPAIILPLLNDLRAVRGADLFSEVALAAPELERKLVAAEVSEEGSDELPELIRRLRHKYHIGLLQWFRGTDQPAGISSVGDVLKQLESVAGTSQVKRLFQVARAALSAPLENMDAPNIAIKMLFGRVDRELRRIINEGERPVAETPAVDAVRDLLYYVASVKQGDELVQSVKQEFDLDNLIISRQQVEQGREGLDAPNVELLESLKQAIGTELAEIKDVLDLFIRTKSSNSEQLMELEPPMRKVADTLGMISQGALRQRMKRQADRIKEISTTGEVIKEQDLLEMAGDIIFVEASLENLASLGQTQFLQPQEEEAADTDVVYGQELPEGEFERLMDSVVREASVDMAKIKESILAYIKAPEKTQSLEQVPGSFHAIAGAFEMLKLFDVSALLRATAGYVSSELIAKHTVPDAQRLNAFADAITSIEYFMETIADGRGIQNRILDVAREALVRLGTESDTEDEEFYASAEGEETIPGLITRQDMEPEPEVVGQDEPPEEELLFTEDVDVEFEAPQETVPAAEKPGLEEVDPEILDIFIEEAREELDVIREYLGRWLADIEDSEALMTFRRSFHTLKGSGRLVGAKTIGEFAWSIENLLNRVIDQTIPVTAEHTALLQETLDVLPGLVECQANGVPPEMDVQPIMERANLLATPDYSAAPRSGHESDNDIEVDLSEQDQEPSATDSDLPAALISIDPTLLEIFASESRTHIDTINAFLNKYREAGGVCAVDREVSRAFHTLHGSAHMAGVDPIAEVSAGLETYVNELLEQGLLADRTLLQLIERSDRQFESILEAINVPGAEIPDWQVLLEDIERAHSSLLHDGAESDQHDAAPEAEDIDESVTVEGEADDSADEPDELDDTFEHLESLLPHEIEPLPDLDEELTELDTQTPEQQEPVATDEVEDSPDLDEGAIEPDALTPEQQEPTAEDGVEESPDQGGQGAEHDPKPVTDPAGSAGSEDHAATPEAGPDFAALAADDDLTSIFIEESMELMDDVDHALKQWRAEPTDPAPLEELQRTLHTLKGGARLSGITPIGDLSHTFESLLTGVSQGAVANDDAVQSLAQRVADGLMTQIEQASDQAEVTPADAMIAEMHGVLTGDSQSAADQDGAASEPEAEATTETPDESDEAAVESSAEADQTESESEITAEERDDTEAAGVHESGQVLSFPGQQVTAEKPDAGPVRAVESGMVRPTRRSGREQLRVNPDLMDKLVNNAGEVSIFRSRLEQQNGALGYNIEELKHTVQRLREQLRKLDMETEAQILFRYERDKEEGRLDGEGEEFDPLEMDRFSTMQQLSRGLLETVGDLSNINKLLESEQKGTETLLLQQSRITTDLQDGLMRTRMVSFKQLVPRLQRIVRQTCQPLHKQAKMKVNGAEMELDRSILDRITAPLEHLLRNAVSHGIEEPEQRRDLDKPAVGQISIDLTREGNDVVLTMSDDGMGLDFTAIKERAEKSGLLADGADASEGDLTQFILEHGFSTADAVNQISGRGVGLDVVVSEIKQLGGTLDIESKPGAGTEFTIYLPLTLAITDALLLQASNEIYAVPYTNVDAVVRINRDELVKFYGGGDGDNAGFDYGGHNYTVRYLGTLLGGDAPNLTEQKKRSPVLLVRAGKHRIAIHVDDVIGHRQIVVKSVGPQLSTIRWITGGTILGDGRVALILDVNALVRKDASQTVESEGATPMAEKAVDHGTRIMVVDDSITVRKVTGRLLERHGMQVETAMDGVDALAMLQDYHPDVMLLDIEMPRMDGFEVARHMRNSAEMSDIPIIIITSRTGEKHRKLAMDLGVKRYLGKPYQETDLLENIQSVLEESRK
jgi:chemosensory pili system protein ChpA (sensor histidine kinase/response regulator)